jgi:hypothetical protein
MTPAALGLGSLVLSVMSLLSLAPADDIAQLDTSDSLGVGLNLPGPHAHQISVGVRFAVSALALWLAISAVRRLFGRRIATDDMDRSDWMNAIVGAGALVAVVALILNVVALVGALANGSTIYSVYNHIGS